MKTKSRLLFASLILGVCTGLDAQTLFSDPLATDNSVWSNSPPYMQNQGGGDLIFFGSGLGLVVGTPTGGDIGMRTLSSYGAPSTSSWRVSVDVHLAALPSLVTGESANLNLFVGKASDGTNNNTTFALDRYAIGGVVRDFDTFVTTAGSKVHLAEVLNATNDATLMIAYDSAAKTLDFSYDDTGSGDGATFLTAHSGIDISGWAMGPSDTFGFMLIGASNSNLTFVATDAYFQNFAVQATAVPEPSTYATLAGLAALGLAMFRRSRPRSG